MVITQKIQNQSPLYVGLLDADFRAGGLESQVLTQSQPGFLFNIQRLMGHGCIHRESLMGFLLALRPLRKKSPALMRDAPGKEETIQQWSFVTGTTRPGKGGERP